MESVHDSFEYPEPPPPAPVNPAILDCESKFTNECWLVKVPQRISELWESQEDERVGEILFKRNKSIGRLDLTYIPDKKLTLDDELPQFVGTLDPSIVQKLVVIGEPCSGEDAEKKKMIEGFVTGRIMLLPDGMWKPKKRVEKNLEADIGKRLLPADFDVVSHLSRPLLRKTVNGNCSEKKDRRFRGNRDDIRQLIFDAFESKPNWAAKDLSDDLDQPSNFILEILHDIGLPTNTGAEKGTWKLKPEYCHYAPE